MGETAVDRVRLSARAYDRLLNVTPTIAGLAGQEPVAPEHMTDAIHHRKSDRAAAPLRSPPWRGK